MNKERLLTLATYLDSVPPERFSLISWKTERPCGTVACACGHACDIPEFKAAGLHLEVIWPHIAKETYYILRYGAEFSTAAAATFFGITEPDTEYLFFPRFYPYHSTKPSEVATRIREFVTNRG